MAHHISKNGYLYHIRPFYTIIQECQWLNPHILSSIISANLVDPLDVHEEIMEMVRQSYAKLEDYLATKRNAVTILTSIVDSNYQNHFIEMLTDTTVNGQLHSCQVSKPYPVGHANHVWWFYERLHGLDGKCIFCVDLQNRWERSCTRDTFTLLEFRYPLMNPLLDQGLDVNLHIFEFYAWIPEAKSKFPNVWSTDP